jgi:hypothetical protein
MVHTEFQRGGGGVEVVELAASRTIPTSDPRKGYRLSHLCVFVPLGENDVIASRLLQKEKWMAEISRFERTSLVVVMGPPSVRRRCGKCHSNWTLEKRE